MKNRSDLKHASMARVWAEDKENEARKDTKVAEYELRLAREELQAVKGDLWAKMAALERARQEVLEAGNSVECLTEELDKLCMDLVTQWPSGWLSFQRRASRPFLDLEFNIQLFDEEVEGSASEAKVDAGADMFSGAPDRAPLPGDS